MRTAIVVSKHNREGRGLTQTFHDTLKLHSRNHRPILHTEAEADTSLRI